MTGQTDIPQSAPTQMSPDGRWQWDGTEWTAIDDEEIATPEEAAITSSAALPGAGTETPHASVLPAATVVPPASETGTRRQWVAPLALLGVVALVVGVVAVISNTGSGDADSLLRDAYSVCSSGDGGDTLDLGDSGNTLIIDTGSAGTIDGAACVFLAIGTPQSVIAAVDSTTAMMGVQTADASGVHYSWSYHPDNGLNMVVTRLK